jgi:hypothetical protein
MSRSGKFDIAPGAPHPASPATDAANPVNAKEIRPLYAFSRRKISLKLLCKIHYAGQFCCRHINSSMTCDGTIGMIEAPKGEKKLTGIHEERSSLRRSYFSFRDA